MSFYDTDFPADSLEFCPHPLASSLFTCGTYKLVESNANLVNDPTSHLDDGPHSRTQKRRGKCMMFCICNDDLNVWVDYSDKVSPLGLRKRFPNSSQIQEIDLPAIPDLKWCHRSSSVPPILGVADSEGNISLHSLDLEKKLLSSIQHISCASSHVLCLSLDWSNRIAPTTALGSLVVSLSDGSLSLLKPRDSTGLMITDSWSAHDFEPWVAAWNYWDTNIIYSGGDDLKLKGWDIRQGLPRPIFTNKNFNAGVTCIQSNPHIEHLFAVGSYDNMVRLFDARKPLVPLAQADVGGGAWRVKWHPSTTRKGDILVACMHDGFKIVRFATSGMQDPLLMGNVPLWEVIKQFDEHKSLAYGADWSFGPSEDAGKTIVGSCSFYDHILHIWKA